MKPKRWTCACLAAMIMLSSLWVFAKNHGHGKHEDDEDERREFKYSHHDRKAMRNWYREHEGHLPPGLAKKEYLPPGLERQLIVRGTLPPGLRDRIQPCPVELERQLPPPPPNYEHVVIGGHIILLNRNNYMVLDIVHFDR